MASSSNDSGSSEKRLDDQLIDVDIESYTQNAPERRPEPAYRLWKIPLPLRRGLVLSDLVKNVACLATLL